MSDPADRRVTVIGAGRMGGAMVTRLAQAGTEVVVYNRTREKAARVADRGGAAAVTAPVTVADTPRAAAAAARVVLVSLADDAAVTSVYAGANGLAAGLRPDTVVLETSTIDPETVAALYPLVDKQGAALLDAPVSGSVPLVERGELTVMVGGGPGPLERARPVLDVLAARVFHVGDLGAGATMKLAVNAVVHALNVALAESLVLAEKAGVDRATAYEVFAASAVGAPFVQYKRAAFEHPEDTPVAFSLDLVAKDLDLIHRLASRVGARMDQSAAGQRLVEIANAAGYRDRDMSAVADFLRRPPAADRRPLE